jgi:tellurite methyltransferase
MAMDMEPNASIFFFDEQFKLQAESGENSLNPFERLALPHVQGKVLDYGCGMGNLAISAARKGCTVAALDGSHAAIDHVQKVANRESLAIDAREADLRMHEIAGYYDTVLCIGLLMFFDCPTAYQQLSGLQSHVQPGGIAVINVLIEGTTYMDMFSPEGHCLFKPDELHARFAGWEILRDERQTFPAPGNTTKIFATIIARKPMDPGIMLGY